MDLELLENVADLQLDLSPETSEGALCESICRAAERACLCDARGVHLNVETLKHLLADVVEEFAVLKASLRAPFRALLQPACCYCY